MTVDLHLLPSWPQSQDSLKSQMVELIRVANRLGLYDAATFLSQRSATAPPPESLRPIPLSERLPGSGDCDLHGRCWVWNAGSCGWWELVHMGMISYSHEDYTHWLPYNAFPIPEVTQ